MDYLEYDISLEPVEPWRDILIAHMEGLPFDTYENHDQGFKAWCTVNADKEQIQNSLNEFTETYEIALKVESNIIKGQNWNEEWEKNFEPIEINSFCRIRAPFHSPSDQFEYEILIEPQMSFGTGHHDTTWGMINQMANNSFADKTVLDMGCGTGILGILAEKMGAAKVIGIDNDEWAYQNSLENLSKNNCNLTDVSLGDGSSLQALPNEQFDFVLANINRNILIDQMADYERVLKPNGQLFLSGFLTTDEKVMKNTLEKYNFEDCKTFERNNWMVIVVTKSMTE